MTYLWISLTTFTILAILIIVSEIYQIKKIYNMSIRDYLWCLKHDVCPIHIWPHRSGICRFCQMDKHILKQTERQNEWEAFDNRIEEMKEKYGRSN